MSSNTSTTTTTDENGKTTTTSTSSINTWEGELSDWWQTFHAHLTNWTSHAVNVAKAASFLSLAKLAWTAAQHWF